MGKQEIIGFGIWFAILAVFIIILYYRSYKGNIAKYIDNLPLMKSHKDKKDADKNI